jgi:hypothetical protein
MSLGAIPQSHYGRIYRMSGTARETWRQTGAWAPAHDPNGGIAYRLTEAEAAFERVWDAGSHCTTEALAAGLLRLD